MARKSVTPQIDIEPSKSRRLANLTGGSRKGVPNRATKILKDMVLGALDDVGGQKYLAQQARENPTAFLTLVGKVLPLQIKADVTNTDVVSFDANPEWTERIAQLPDSDREDLRRVLLRLKNLSTEAKP